MDELLRRLPPESVVIDLGSGRGSFDAPESLLVIRVDRQAFNRPAKHELFVQADAGQLPLRDDSVDCVVCNHSLEHFVDLEGALKEIARTLKRSGAAFISVPDASTLSDRIYRWMGRGGGHVNAFSDARALGRSLQLKIGMQLRSVTTLYTSFSFLNRKNIVGRPQKKLWLFLRGNERFLVILNWVVRWFDKVLKTRLAVYGWAMFFGDVPADVRVAHTPDVCVRCGSGHTIRSLEHRQCVKRFLGFPVFWRCPRCGVWHLTSPAINE